MKRISVWATVLICVLMFAAMPANAASKQYVTMGTTLQECAELPLLSDDYQQGAEFFFDYDNLSVPMGIVFKTMDEPLWYTFEITYHGTNNTYYWNRTLYFEVSPFNRNNPEKDEPSLFRHNFTTYNGNPGTYAFSLRLAPNSEYLLYFKGDSLVLPVAISFVITPKADPNGETRDTAAVMAPAELNEYTMAVYEDVDYFKIPAASQDREVTFIVRNRMDIDGFTFNLHDSFKELIASSVCTYNQYTTITATLEADLDYYVHLVEAGNKHAEGRYELGYCYNETHLAGEPVTVDPTCMDEGSITYPCAICGEAYEVISLPKVEHQPSGEWSVKTAATCTETGKKVQRCIVCNEIVLTEEIPATGHAPGAEIEVTEATCISTGKKATYCTSCNEELTSSILPAVAHKYGLMTTVSAATCVENGRNEQHCTVCNVLLASEEVPAYGHKSGAWKTIKEPSCTAAGMKQQMCSVCNEVLKSEEIPAVGHASGKWEVAYAATCVAEGKKEQHCAACNTVLADETIPATGHSPTDWVVAREAACLQSGMKEKKCSVCGLTLETEQINALGHIYSEWEIIKEATKTQEGEKRRHCINCGDTVYEVIPREKILGFI